MRKNSWVKINIGRKEKGKKKWCKGITTHKQTNVQPVSEQWPLWTDYPPILSLSMTLYGMEYLFGQLGLAVPSVSPSRLLPTSSLLAVGAEWETEKDLMLCKYCSTIAEPLVCYQYCFIQSKTKHCMGCYEHN